MLISQTKSESEEKRIEAILAIGRLGTGAVPAVPALRGMLADRSAAVRMCAVPVLAKLTSLELDSIKPIVAAAQDPDASVREIATLSLGSLLERVQQRGGPKPTWDKIVTQLQETAKDQQVRVRTAAAMALSSTEGLDETASTCLITLATDSDTAVQASALLALSRFALCNRFPPQTKQALEQTISLLHHKRTQYRVAALTVLRHLRADALSALPHVLGTLQDADWEVRCAAVEVLAQLGPRATEALPILGTMLNDKEPTVRKAVAKAIRSIQGESNTDK
jgi:HEAT repeat protein